MNYTLDQLRELARQTMPDGTPVMVRLNKKLTSQKTGRVYWTETNPIPAKVAFKNLSLPYEKRQGGWKNIHLTNESTAAYVPQFRIDQNPLSNLELIEQLSNLGLELKPKEIAPVAEFKEQVPPAEKSLADYSDEELLEYLKSKGAVHGKVKLKGETEEPVEPPVINPPATEPPATNPNTNETGATA